MSFDVVKFFLRTNRIDLAIIGIALCIYLILIFDDAFYAQAHGNARDRVGRDENSHTDEGDSSGAGTVGPGIPQSPEILYRRKEIIASYVPWALLFPIALSMFHRRWIACAVTLGLWISALLFGGLRY